MQISFEAALAAAEKHYNRWEQFVNHAWDHPDYWLFCGGTSDGKACIGTRFVSVSKETGKLKSHAIFSTETEKLFADARNTDERLLRREKE